MEWLGQPAVDVAAWETYILAIRDNMNAAFMRASAARQTLKNTRERLGLPFMVEPGEGAVRTGAWDAGFEQNFKELGSMVATLTRFADEALAGQRRLGTDDNGVLGFERLSSDFSRVEVVGTRPVEINNETDRPVVVTGTVSALPAIVVGLIVVAAAVTTYFVVEQVCDTVENVAEQKTFETLSANQTKQIEAGATPEQAKALTESLYEGAATVHQARALEATAGRSEIPQTIRTVGYIALGLGALYLVAQLIMRRGGGGVALAPARLLENPVRRSGDVKVDIRYRDAEDDYAGKVTWPGGSWKFDELRSPPAWAGRIAVDSAEAYDKMAEAALGFASFEEEEILAHADFDFDDGKFRVRRR